MGDNQTTIDRLQERRWRWMNYCPQTVWDEGAVRDQVDAIDRELRAAGVHPGEPYAGR